jgi:hypothetical protein
MRFIRLIFLLSLPLLFSGCVQAQQKNSPHSAAYLYQWPGYFPTISGDGSTLVADINDAIWLWRPGQRAKILFKIPANYHVGRLAISFDGQTVAGSLEPDGEQLDPQVFYPGRNNRPFLWDAGTGIKMLPELPADDHIDVEQVNDTGHKIALGCTDRRSVPGLVVACRDGPFIGSKDQPYLKLWTSAHGYQNITLPNGDEQNLDNLAGDFQAYLVEHDLPGTGCRTVLLTADGRQVPIPLPGKFRPCLAMYSSYDDKYFAQEVYPGNDFRYPGNRYLVVWDAKGNEVWRRKPLPGCGFGLINAIDDFGNIYATEECFAHDSLWSEGVRVTASGTETLKHWIESAHAGSSLPLDLMVNSVSANGETIYGSESNGIAVGGVVASRPSAQTIVPGAPADTLPGFAPGIPFIAHVP